MRILSLLALLSLLATPSPEVLSQAAPSSQSTSQRTEYKLDPITAQNATYPAQAREKKVEGQVVASFVVSQAGEVANVHAWNVHALSDDATLTQAVEDAVTKWKFGPVMKDGSPIQVVSKATFRFDLGDPTQLSNGVPGEIGTATDIPRKVRVSSGVISGLLVRRVNPIYPEKARKEGIQGTVLLTATIDHDGTVTNLQPLSGPQELIPAAIEAVKQWQYKPYLLMGMPMEVETQVQVNFVLRSN